ncbi:MAG: hypothetical protein OK457_09070 [Thaumarchaeota archaeon]|nr:hypothetical protein [Nitrososphaerota archaeon]
MFYVIEGLNEVMIYNNVSEALVDLLIVAVFAIEMIYVAVRVFKWRGN